MIEPIPKQPRSEDLIRHRKYNRCVVCEERLAERSDEAVATKWWTCKKCEEGSK
jgi:uncharacterized protein with PIN domain